ncbi:hypothetical protein AAG647_32665, partial [Pseudomonas aeruginosa]
RMVQCGSKYPARATHQDVSHFLVRDILAPLVSGQQLKPANIFAGICLLPQGVVILTGCLPWLGPGAEPQQSAGDDQPQACSSAWFAIGQGSDGEDARHPLMCVAEHSLRLILTTPRT